MRYHALAPFGIELEIDPTRPLPSAQGREFRELFFDAIRLRLTRADVEVGSCLSGGLDSSSIVCSMHHLGESRARDHQTFSILCPGTEIDESPYVEEVVKLAGLLAGNLPSVGLYDVHLLVRLEGVGDVR